MVICRKKQVMEWLGEDMFCCNKVGVGGSAEHDMQQSHVVMPNPETGDYWNTGLAGCVTLLMFELNPLI